jgi:alpha-beta hydrolase superfamily lysophospholipase
MTVRHDEGKLGRLKSDGPTLYFNIARPEGAPVAAVGLLHGYADYGARYAHVVDAWAERGILSIAIDMRGHGRAEGKPGVCERFEQYLDDTRELARLVEERASGVPAFLFGHSFGGLVAASFAIAHPSPWRGLLLSAPFFGLAMGAPLLNVLVGKIASVVAPALGQPSGLRGADLTHDDVRARTYDDDPLVFKNVNARWFTETQAAQARAIDQAGRLTMPLYVVMGTQDRIAKVASARAFFEAAGSADKTWDACEGLFHEVLNEPEWPQIAARIADWILSHT